MSHIESDQANDTLLLQQIAQGSKQAFNELFEKYWELAYSDTYKRLKNEDDAKDIVQKIFTQLWINRQTQNIQNLPAYLHVSIRNGIIKFISRQQLTHPFMDVLNNIPERNSQADANLLSKEFFRCYEALLQSLPPKRQIIFRLRYQEDLSTNEIARKLGISRKTVQNQLARGIESIKVSLLHIRGLSIILVIFNS